MNTRKQGFLQAAGVVVYCSLVGLLFWKGNAIFPHLNPFLGPVMMLLLFSCSVLVSALIVFYKPYKLFFSGKKTEAVNIVFSTALWLFVFLIFSFALMVVFR